MKRFAPLLLCLVIATAVYAQPYVKLFGGDNGTIQPLPASSSNPVPITGTISSGTITTVTTITNPVGHKGVDGSTIASASNVVPMANYIAGAVNSATNGIFSNLLQGNAVLTAQNGIFAASTGVAQASITNATTSVANSDTTITLVAASSHVTIKTDSGAAVIYVDLANGTASTADFKIDSGGSFTYNGAPISSFHYIGASVTGNISVEAN